MTELAVDLERWNDREYLDGLSNYYVRAKVPDVGWEVVNISLLTRESLLEWLSKYGDMNSQHINIIGTMLGHKSLM